MLESFQTLDIKICKKCGRECDCGDNCECNEKDCECKNKNIEFEPDFELTVN